MKTATQRYWIYGRHACLAALQNPERDILKAMAVRLEPPFDALLSERKIKPEIVAPDKLDKLLEPHAVHQGIALYVQSFSIILEEFLETLTDTCAVLILDQVTDPQNIGAILRSAAAFGVKAVILQDKNAPEEGGALAKAASGALEKVSFIRVSNIAHTLQKLKDNGFWTYGFAEGATGFLEDTKFQGRTAFVMGSEGKGLRRLVQENCDAILSIQTDENFSTLNVSVASAIVLHHWRTNSPL